MLNQQPGTRGDAGEQGGEARRPVPPPGRRAAAFMLWRPHARRWWPFALPAMILVAVFFLLPFVLNVRFAFTSWTGFNANITWNGLQNFRELMQEDILLPAIRVTLLYAVVGMIVQNAFSLSMALLLQTTNKANSVFRAVFFLPVLIAPVAAGFIWAGILAPKGPLNSAISLVVPGFNYAWLGHANSALVAVASIDAWKWSGLITLVYIAGLNSIPHSLMEAAMLDGANAWQRFWRVRFRLLAPAFTFSIVVTLLGAISAFDIVQATTLGGPGKATTVLNVAMYGQYGSGFFGTASALSLTVTVLVVVIAVPLISFLRRREVTA